MNFRCIISMARDKTRSVGAEGSSVPSARHGRLRCCSHCHLSSISEYKAWAETTLWLWRPSGGVAIWTAVDRIWAVCCRQHRGFSFFCYFRLFLALLYWQCVECSKIADWKLQRLELKMYKKSKMQWRKMLDWKVQEKSNVTLQNGHCSGW